MIKVKLREAIQEHRRRTGTRLTYQDLSRTTGISVETLQSLATRTGYNTRLNTIEKLCKALRCTPGEILELRTRKGAADEDR